MSSKRRIKLPNSLRSFSNSSEEARKILIVFIVVALIFTKIEIIIESLVVKSKNPIFVRSLITKYLENYESEHTNRNFFFWRTEGSYSQFGFCIKSK